MNRESNLSILRKIVKQINNQEKKNSNYVSSIMTKNEQNKTQNNEQKYSRQLQKNQHDFEHQNIDLQICSQQLKLQSRIPNEIDCLYIQSRVELEPLNNEKQQQQIQLPLQCLQSKINSQKIKVHSSIDGMQSSKSKTVSSKEQISIPLSDLIMTDNNYLKLSNQLNEHCYYEESYQSLKAKHFQNLKILKQQSKEQIQIIEQFLELMQYDKDLIQTVQKISLLENEIFRIRLSSKINSSKQLISFNSRQISKTPEMRNVRSFKSPSIKVMQYEQNLQFKINSYKQKIRQQRQKQVKVTSKLSKAKSDFKKLQEKLSDWQQSLKQNISLTKISQNGSRSPKPKKPITPQSPRMNGRIKHYEYLQKQKIKYYQTLKKHVYVICEQIQTFNDYQFNRSKQLQEQIILVKNQLKYLDVKSVQKIFFTSPQYKGFNVQSSREKSPKPSTFQNNYSQKLISSYSSKSIRKYIPPLSPRTPQVHSITPQIHSNSKCTQIYSPLSMTRKMMKSKDPNNLSEKSTNYSHATKIKSSSQKIIVQTHLSPKYNKLHKGKQNKQNKQSKLNINKGYLMGQIVRKQLNSKNKLTQNKKAQKGSNRKSFTNLIHQKNQYQLQLQRQLSDYYDLNSQNEYIRY